MKKKMTLEELTEELNKLISLEGYQDKRVSESIKSRRIRDYIYKKIVSEGIREGRSKYYTNDHLKELINVRKYQSEGLNDNDIKQIIELEKNKEENEEKDILNNLLSDIKNRNNISGNINVLDDTNSISNMSLKSSLYLSTRALGDNGQVDNSFIQSETWTEYQIENDLILKIKSDKKEDKKSIENKLIKALKKIQEK